MGRSRRPRGARRWWWAALLAGALVLGGGAARADDGFGAQRDRLMAQRTGVVVGLGVWATSNLVVGTSLVADPSWLSPSPADREYRRWFGVATLSFAVVNAVLAGLALSQTASVRGELTDFAALQRERRATGDIFAVNVGLDMLYLTAGALLQTYGTTPRTRGFGAGVIAQGGGLIVFDTAAAMIYRHGGR